MICSNKDLQKNSIISTEENKRLYWLDALKGIAMIMVMLGHLNLGSDLYYLITSPIKLPLFFMVTGFTFNTKRTFPEFLKINIFKRLVIPLFFLSLYPLYLLYYTLINRNFTNLWEKTYALISGETLWYINSLIFAQILFYIVRKLSNKHWQVYLSSVVLGILGFVFAKFNLLDFCCINTAFIAQLYLCAGFLMKENNSFEGTKLMKKPWITIAATLFLFGVLVIVSCIIYPGKIIDIHNNRYYNYALSLSMIALSCFGIWQLVSRCGRLKVLEYYGKNSLIFYCLHTWGFFITRTALSVLRIEIPWSLAEKLTAFVGASVFCTICAWFINKFVPFIAGGRKNR